METREFWFFVSLLLTAISACVSLVICATYIPLKKFPVALRDVASFWYQKIYFILVLSLFGILVGLGVYIPLTYELFLAQDIQEITRLILFVVCVVSLFSLTLSFKKQTLHTKQILFHAIFASLTLVAGTQENLLDLFKYLYVFVILALFTIVRYGVHIFSQKLQ